nr:hypothetical protein [Tanacetum cinerariifolium]
MFGEENYARCYRDEHHRMDRPDLLGEWQEIYKEYKVDIAVLVEKLGLLELDEHAKYDMTYSRVLAELHLQSSSPYQVDYVFFPLLAHLQHIVELVSWGSTATDIPSSSSLVMTGTVRFENDHIARIMGYGDYQLGNITISRVYYVEGFGHNLFSIGSRDINLYTISLDDMLKTSPICLLSRASKTESCLWHRRLSHLNFGTINKLAKDSLTLRKFYENVGISHQTSVVGTPQQNGVVERRNRILIEAARTIDDWDRLFQHVFDEYFTPPSIDVSPVQEAATLRAVVLAESFVSPCINQDAPSTSIPSTQEQEHSPNISQGFKESLKTPSFRDDPLHEDSTS